MKIRKQYISPLSEIGKLVNGSPILDLTIIRSSAPGMEGKTSFDEPGSVF